MKHPSCAAKPSQSVNWGSETCVKRRSTSPLSDIPAFHRIAGHRHLPCNWGKSRKTSARVTEWCSAVQRRTRFVLSTAIAGNGLDWPAVPCSPWLSCHATGSTHGQLRYLPSCHARGFPISANFESKSWSGPWCGRKTAERPDLVPVTHQGASVARRRHLDCNTCNLRTWERAADLHAGHA